MNSDGTVTFSSTRPLDCNTENTFVIELDKSMPMVSALKVAAQGETITFSFHEDNHFNYNWYFNSDGTCLEATTDPCLISVSDGSTLSMSYDSTTEMVNYKATLIDNSYLGLGYGSSMTDTDMVIFSADGASSTVYPVYSTTEEKPSNQTGACYADPTVTVLTDGAV